MNLLLFYLFLALGVSFLCSLLESVLLSITPSYASAFEKRSPRIGRRIRKLKADIDRPLAAILSLNTIAHTVGAAGVGAQAQAVFQSVPFSIISGVLTLLILFLSEIVPKTVGATYWRLLAVPSGWAIRGLTLGLWPLVWMSQKLSGLLTHGASGHSVSREEIFAYADLGWKSGVIDRQDADAIRAVAGFHAVTVRRILTPRTIVFTLPREATVGEVMQADDDLSYSRIPLEGEDADDITGYVMKSDILAAAARDQHGRTLGELERSVLRIPDTASVKTLLQRFLKEREHLAVALDEFGGFSGVVTLEDVVETLIGTEIMDETDDVADLRAEARKRTSSRDRSRKD